MTRCFHWLILLTLKGEIISILHSLFQNTEEEETHPNSVCKGCIILIPKPDKYINIKLQTQIPHEHTCKNPESIRNWIQQYKEKDNTSRPIQIYLGRPNYKWLSLNPGLWAVFFPSKFSIINTAWSFNKNLKLLFKRNTKNFLPVFPGVDRKKYWFGLKIHKEKKHFSLSTK